MTNKFSTYIGIAALAALFSTYGVAEQRDKAAADHPGDAETCQGFGPQSPRDIDNLAGDNRRSFALAPDYDAMNLCNIHFHNNAEHRAKDFSIYAGEGDKGVGGGYQCAISQSLSKSEMQAPKEEICKGIKPGDTVEMHWVYSTCVIKPGKGLSSCLSDKCVNPDLRVETQVFTVVNDPAALKFGDFGYDGNVVNGLHQAKSLPESTGAPVEFAGSTTGLQFTDKQCSPMHVTWNVRPQCAKVDINSLGEWCNSNVFQENHAHGVRKLVTNPRLLSEIK